MGTLHTSKEFEQELKALRERLLRMGGRAEKQIARAMQAFLERDTTLAEAVIKADDEIDRDEVDVDEMAQAILATRQPVASDLRFITMSLKFVTDLERIGDLAANIAKRVIELNQFPVLSPWVDFAPLAKQVTQNLRDALDSFVSRDAEKAASIIERDREVDRLNATIFGELITRVASHPENANVVIPLTSVARSLERMGDHVKNLAEEVVYMVRARDIRHRGCAALKARAPRSLARPGAPRRAYRRRRSRRHARGVGSGLGVGGVLRTWSPRLDGASSRRRDTCRRRSGRRRLHPPASAALFARSQDGSV